MSAAHAWVALIWHTGPCPRTPRGRPLRRHPAPRDVPVLAVVIHQPRPGPGSFPIKIQDIGEVHELAIELLRAPFTGIALFEMYTASLVREVQRCSGTVATSVVMQLLYAV